MDCVNEDTQRILQLSYFTIEASGDAVFWIDADARIHRANNTACRMYGYSQIEFPTLTVHDINPNIPKNAWPEFWKKVKKDESFTFLDHHQTKGGRLFPVEGTINFIELEGEEYICSFVHDITDRLKTENEIRASEKRFRDIFSAVNDGIFILDPEKQCIVETNQKVVNMLGYDYKELIGMPIERIHPDDMEQLMETMKDVFAGQPVNTDEFSCLRKDQQRVPANISLSPVQLNKKTYILAMIRDITERKQAEEALRNALTEVEQLKSRLQAENIYLQEEIKIEHNFEEIISGSDSLKRVLRKVEQVASTDATVLILGETGTGKELFARAVHNISARGERPLVKVNCAALPANLIESELFGHEKGAFTGALASKIGRFELADGGTIFLDEIGDLPLELQAKLLRILQDGEFERLGDPHTHKVDVRILAATNRDLINLIANGEFREDLYYRLNVFPIEIPPLRERQSAIPLLARHFVMKFGKRIGKKIESIPQKAMTALQNYHWPGNVRELENIIERAVITSQGKQLYLGDWLPKKGTVPGESRVTTLEELEREHITGALETTGWRVSGDKGAAKILGIKSTTLEARMKKLGIKRKA